MIVAILRFVPYLGPLLGASMPFLLSLAIFRGWDRPLMTLGLFAVTELVISNLVEPVLYGEHTGLSSVAILVAAVFWTALWGPIGLVVSTPLTVCVVVLGRHIPRLGFLHVLFGDEPVLTPDSHFYRRLLAMDHEEAKNVLEAHLKDETLEDLYDSVLIRALSLAEQDRHRNQLDEATERFICQSTREIIEDLGARLNQEAELRTVSDGEEAVSNSETMLEAAICTRFIKVVCLPARDEADEIIGVMLAQVLERAGYRAQVISTSTAAEMLAEVLQSKPDIVCLSALPPFAISHARSLYSKLRAQLPRLKSVVGLWNFSGDLKSAASRMGITEHGTIFTTLSRIVQEIGASSRLGTVVARQPSGEAGGQVEAEYYANTDTYDSRRS